LNLIRQVVDEFDPINFEGWKYIFIASFVAQPHTASLAGADFQERESYGPMQLYPLYTCGPLTQEAL